MSDLTHPPTTGLYWEALRHVVQPGETVAPPGIVEMRLDSSTGSRLVGSYRPTVWHLEGDDAVTYLVIDEWEQL